MNKKIMLVIAILIFSCLISYADNKIVILLVNRNIEQESHLSLSASVTGIVSSILKGSDKISILTTSGIEDPKYIMGLQCSTLGGNVMINMKLTEYETSNEVYADSITVKRKTVTTGAKNIANKFVKYVNANKL